MTSSHRGRQFGEVAGVYDDVRPGYSPEVTAAILAYHGGRPATVAELGAGTGKGTEVLLPLGWALTCVEPDARMAAPSPRTAGPRPCGPWPRPWTTSAAAPSWTCAPR